MWQEHSPGTYKEYTKLSSIQEIEPKEKQSKKDCLIQLLNKNQIKYEEGLWDEAV